MGQDPGEVVRNYTKKVILPSSGERRLRRAKRRIVLDVFLAREPTWKHIREMRGRWGIEAQTQVPPPYQGAEYTPQSLHLRPEEDFGEEAERWSATFHEWRNDLAVLYEAVVPAEARDSDYHTSFGWSVFLSMCVLFDPPETQLVDFAERFGWAGSTVIPRGDRTMNAPPIVWRKEHNQLEATWIEFYEGLLGALLEKYVHPQGVTTEEAMGAIRKQNPEIFERWRQRLHTNESRPFIDVQHHTSEGIDSAFQVLSDRHDARPASGREKRDELTAVQCAILHERYNLPDPKDRRRRTWTFERLAEHFEDLESPRAAKDHVALGSSLLNQVQQN